MRLATASTPAEFATIINADIARWQKVMNDVDINPGQADWDMGAER